MISIYSVLKSLTYSILLLLICQQYGALKFHEKKVSHEAKVLDSNEINQLANVSNADFFVRILQNICIPRVVGSHTHEKVKEFIMEELIELGWSVELDSFRARTPQFGELSFSNVVGRLNPVADRYLVLSCHYDSKYMREHEFLGATDSAVPCAMMLDLADKLKGELELAKQSELSLMFIFFDGEEAFQQWSSTDSIYGARNLAYVWYNKPYPGTNDTTNNLHRMDLLVLLDLLGAVGPQFYNYFVETERWHRRLVSAERRLHHLGHLAAPRRPGGYFLEKSTYAHIEDDHLPFLRAGVPVLHVIPHPFPDEWHTPNDNWSVLDFETIDDLSKILRVFVIEYLSGSQNLDLPQKYRASRIEI